MLLHYLHYVYIDVAGVIAIVMDIWGDRHASAYNPSFVFIVLCALELRFLLTGDCRRFGVCSCDIWAHRH